MKTKKVKVKYLKENENLDRKVGDEVLMAIDGAEMYAKEGMVEIIDSDLTNKDFIESVKWIYENVPEEQRQRLYLKLFDNQGKRFTWSVNEDKNEWIPNYTDKKFEPRINLIERLGNVVLIEFDNPLVENGMKPKEALEEAEKKLKSNGFGYIKTTHKGKCDYLWVEFESVVSDNEAEKFLNWICPNNSRIDTNFKSSNKVFPVIFAPHRKHPHKEEIVYIIPGKKIILSKLKLPKEKLKKIKENKNGFEYETGIKKQIKFDFDEHKPAKPIESLEELEAIITKNFPTIWFETKACLSVCASMSLKSLNGCPSLNLIGKPSGEKTTVLSFFYGQHNTYMSDDFTPKSFVSHSANVKEEELEQVDLLPKLKDKVLITPELAPLFEAPRDRLVDNFAILTRVLDGEGLNRDTGTHGHRGYSGDYKFAWLGASTPLRASVWNVMGKIGNRLFFLNVREKNRNAKDYLEMFTGKAYEEKVKECRGAVKSYLDFLYSKNGLRSIEWDTMGDVLLLPEIIKYASFLSKLRASLMTWKSEEQGTYEYNFPIQEEPPRAINSLYNLAKGHALINGRRFLKKEDLDIVKSVCFSSMPHDRSEFLKLLIKHEGKLTTKQISNELNCSQDTALRTMKIFEVIGIVTIKDLQVFESGRPLKYIEIKEEFSQLLAETQGVISAINPIPQETRGVSDPYSDINLTNLVKKLEKNSLSHTENDEVNTLSQETRPVWEEEKVK